jgi:multisubunit Na+/H+ antiporter MnhG subunit
MSGQGQPVGGRVMSTGTCIALIALGAILRYAVTTTQTHGINVHVVGLIVLLAGVLGLLLSLLVWSPLNPNRRRAAARAASYDDGRPAHQRVEQRRVYRDEPPQGLQESTLYRDDPPR